MLEARKVLSHETGHTPGHLASALDDGYTNIAKKHGDRAVIMAAESHEWAMKNVGDIAREHCIDCEHHLLPALEISQYDRNKEPKRYSKDVDDIEAEMAKYKALGMNVDFKEVLLSNLGTASRINAVLRSLLIRRPFTRPSI